MATLTIKISGSEADLEDIASTICDGALQPLKWKDVNKYLDFSHLESFEFHGYGSLVYATERVICATVRRDVKTHEE